MIERPVNESGLQHRFIPLRWRNSGMMQPARKTAHTAGRVLGAALKHFSPCTKSHGVRQVEASDGPDQRVQPPNILLGRPRVVGSQTFKRTLFLLFASFLGAPPFIQSNRSTPL